MHLNLIELKKDFDKFSNEWTNTVEYNDYIYQYFEQRVTDITKLSEHNNVVAEYGLGYGEKAFRYLWALIFSQMPEKGRFLEIGVYKGSVLALSQLVSQELNLNIQTYGVTPLDSTGDKYSRYPMDDYEYAISFLYAKLNLNMDNTEFIQGLSTDHSVKKAVHKYGPYDVLYIDGGHDYDTVVNDISLADSVLKIGGLLVMDDASSKLNFKPTHGFTGHSDVAQAVADKLDSNKGYRHLFACGHNRVWLKLI